MAAKKETKEKSAPKFSFDDLSKEIKKVNPQSGMANEKLMSAVNGYIDSGNYMLNACISGSLFGGWPENRFSILAGESSTGKTYVCLSAVKRAIENGYNVVYFDSENAVDEKFFNNFGIDTSKVNYQPVQTVQEFRTIITTILEKLKEAKNKGLEIPKVLFVVDSIGNLATQKEIDDAISGSEKADMTRTKVLKSIFRIIMVPMAEVGATIIGSNHTYQSQSFIPQTIMGGGTGARYAASVVMYLSKAQLKEKENKTGIIVTAKPDKNRFAKPNPIKFHIHYTKGVNPYVGLEQYCTWDICGITKGKIEKGEKIPSSTARGWICKHLDYVVPNEKLFTPEVFTEDVLKQIDEYIKPKFNYGLDEVDDLNNALDEIFETDE